MLGKIKKVLGLTPKATGPAIPDNGQLQIQCGVQDNKVVLKMSRPVEILTFDKVQLAGLLAALALNAKNIK